MADRNLERYAAISVADTTMRFSDAPTQQSKPTDEQLIRNLALAERMQAIGARHGRSAGEVAIAWTLRHPAVAAAIVGMRSAEQVAGVIGAVEFRALAGRSRRHCRKLRSVLAGAWEREGPLPWKCILMHNWCRMPRLLRKSA